MIFSVINGVDSDACEERVVGSQPAIIVPLTATTPQTLLQAAQEAEQAGADVVEFRADYMIGAHPETTFSAMGRELLRDLFETIEIPVLFTVRTGPEGGEVDLSEFRYRVMLATVLDLMMQEELPADRIGIDLEFHSAATPDLAARAHSLGFTPVISHHEWGETPDDEVMHVLYDDMLAIDNAVVKLAVMAHSPEDTQRLLEVTRQVAAASGRPLIGIAMGEAGVRSRVEGWQYGSVATFAAIDKQTAPGQLHIAQLRQSLGRV
ncbi:type I 3-dehydroquinate dehydratase [Trueperella sp. LYQ143]|uniref:type I 3-dehydroquinate dehydratase n=1 Tax=unclassified Trueperella TaxID=2630174 RepID=UPI0039833D3D